MNQPLDNQPIFIDSFNYPLPDERIAKFPLARRDDSKLLVFKNQQITESKFACLVDHLPHDALLVYNNTRVIQARLVFYKTTGSRIEVFCLEPHSPSDYALSLGETKQCVWKCMVGNLKKWKTGALTKELDIEGKKCTFSALLLESDGNTHTIQFTWNNDSIHFAQLLEHAGELPIPPYLHRATEESDKTSYQTVYSKIQGSVAAPTAGLHFTPEVFESLKTKNILTDELTLHVGAGTFQPVKSETIADHHMHTEVISVHKSTIQNLLLHLGNIVAVGTTSVRTLESLYFIGRKINNSNFSLHVSQWEPYQSGDDVSPEVALQNILNYLTVNNLDTIVANTQILIQPGYQFRMVDGIITNFHQPKSTLLLLVSAFVGGQWMELYDYALANDFRFLSYGDSSLLLK